MHSKSDRPHRVLVIYENGAGGHRAAALALASALDQQPSISAEVLEVDTLAPKSRKRLYNGFMDLRLSFRWIVDRGFLISMTPNLVYRLYRYASARIQGYWLRALLSHLQHASPNLVISTHFRPNMACSIWASRGMLEIPVHSVPSDFLLHGQWAQPGIGCYYVAHQCAADDLVRQGVDRGRIQVTGLPISVIAQAADAGARGAAKTKLGLRSDRPAVLVMGGARGDQDYDAILAAFGRAGADIDLAVMCGWNAALKARLESIAEGMKQGVHILGYQKMDDWYAAADVVLTKPGGMTSAEAFALGKAIVYVNAHPGKETAQSRRLEELGVVIAAKDEDDAVAQVLHLLADPTALQQLEERAAAFHRPNGAEAISRHIVNWLAAENAIIS